MATFSKLIIGSAILSSIALAAPFGAKPAWTVTETDWITVDMTTTIYVDDARTMSGEFQPTFAPEATSTPALVESSSTSMVPVLPATMSTSAIPTASPASFYIPGTTAPAVTPAAVVPTYTTTSAYAAATTASLAKNGGTGAPSSASDTATCQGEGAACMGDITYYGGGLGACGINVDPAGNGIALPFEFMGTESNSNPYCGKTLTIYNPTTGASAQATVMDKCMGCTGRSIDLTSALFSSLTNGDLGLGRVSGVDWWFN